MPRVEASDRFVDWTVARITPLGRHEMIDRWVEFHFTDHWWLKSFMVAPAIAARRLLQAKLESAHAELA